MRSTLILLLCFLGFNTLMAQQDTLNTKAGVLVADDIQIKKTDNRVYDPRKAALRSAIIPGWGQITNRSWWKVPLLYGGFGASVYFIYENDRLFHRFKTLLDEEQIADEPNENLIRIYSRNADASRKNRDLVVLTMIGLYGLQIIDATVDAHLKGFNVDENLAMNFKPKFGVIANGTPYMGMKLTIPIGR